MNKASLHRLVIIGYTSLHIATACQAEIQSKSKDIVIVQPQDLPAPAQAPGQSIFLRATSNGSCYLYEEQANGGQIVIYDVTDPAKIKLKSISQVHTRGVFDFIRPLDDKTELIRYRKDNAAAMLDLSDANKPVFRSDAISTAPDQAVITDQQPPSDPAITGRYMPPASKDFDVVDTSAKDHPQLIATVHRVQHQISNDDTGTTFLLNSQGLTVVRQTKTEEAYKIHLQQLSSQ